MIDLALKYHDKKRVEVVGGRQMSYSVEGQQQQIKQGLLLLSRFAVAHLLPFDWNRRFCEQFYRTSEENDERNAKELERRIPVSILFRFRDASVWKARAWLHRGIEVFDEVHRSLVPNHRQPPFFRERGAYDNYEHDTLFLQPFLI